MMIVFAPRETDPRETRAPLTPDTAKKLVELGLEVEVECGIGGHCDHPDGQYEEAGCKLVNDRDGALGRADFVFRVRKPDCRACRMRSRILGGRSPNCSELPPSSPSSPWPPGPESRAEF